MIVIGAGRVGQGLQQAARARGLPCTLITRQEGWQALEGTGGTPVLVAVRNDDLDPVLQRVPPHRRGDLVFVQNGMIRPWLQARRLGGCTRGLLFFAVPRRGDPIEPGGTCPFCGPLASAVVGWLGAAGVPAEEVDWARFTSVELEKLLWNSVFGLLCERFDTDVEGVVKRHFDALVEVTRELSRVGRAALGVDVPLDVMVRRLTDYSLSIPRYKGAVKEWPWRNGWFDATAASRRIPTPLHRDLVRAVGKGDWLVERPEDAR